VLLDLRMGGRDGLDVLDQLSRSGSSLPVIMLSGHGDLPTAVQAMKLGAIDFLEKPYHERALVAAIERALDRAAESRNREQVKQAAAARLERLSPRERQILQGLLAGMTNKAIGRRLDVSPRTVEMHRANLMDDLGVGSLSEAVRLAIDAELTPLGGEAGDAPPAQVAPAAKAQGPRAAHRPAQLPPSLIDVLEGTTDCAFILDPQWRFTYLNPNAVRTIGRGRDLMGMVIWDAFPLATGTKAFELLRRAAADDQPVRFDFYEPDLGTWFDVNARPVAAGLQVFFRDITPERRASASARMSEETLRLVLEAAGDGAWDWNIASDEIAMSARFLDRLGYQPGGLPEHFDTVRQLIHPDDLSHFSARLNEHLKGESDVFACEYRLRRSDGGWIWNFDRGRVVARDPTSGRPTRMVGSACDVTDRRKDQERAQEAYERLVLAQKNAGAGIWDLDLASRAVRLCRRSAEMHGLPADAPDELGPEEWAKCLHPDDVSRTREELARAIEHGDIYRIEYRTLAADGRCRWVHGLGKVVLNPQGTPVRFLGLNIDITERKEDALMLKRVQSELVHLSRLSAMGAMASTLAHELNQPLTAIVNFVRGVRRLLARPAGSSAEGIDEALLAAERSAGYASDIVRRMREHASLSQAEKRPIRLSEAIVEAVEVAGACAPGGARPLVAIDPSADRVLADPTQIEQVLLNLMRNGREAMDEVGVADPLSITVAPAADGQSLVRVGDSGPGISPERRARLFASFVTSKAHGSGIGLPLCRTIVEAHGGRLWVEDNQPCGAAFCFTLPRAAA
jgi:two-component system sensor kinase FixL